MNPFEAEDDPTVVAAAQQGDRDALTEVVERHRPWIYNIAVRMMGDPGSAEDATQEISMAKIFCGRTSRMVADECIQLHGGYGYMKECVAGRSFVDSRLVSIGGGSDETMIHYLAKMLGF